MRPPYYFQPQAMMNQMPAAPRFPMYAPYMMRGPAPGAGQFPGAGSFSGAGQFMNQMPIPPQAPILGAGAGIPGAGAGNVPKLEGFLSGANSLFNNAQKFTPYIQQAAPMFKNLPALWRLYKGFKDTSDPLESSTVSMPQEQERPRERMRERMNPRGNRREQEPVEEKITTKPSLPKIFQPPFE